jgi:uncharacterized protein with PIN domain
MQGTLARKLRIFGFDTLYFREGADSDLEKIARHEGRIILTSDKALYQHSRTRGVRAILVEGRTDRARLISISRQGEQGVAAPISMGGTSRCAVCNGELEILGKKEATVKGVPAKVLARHRIFFRCKSCSKLYWRGRHWEELRRLVSSVRTKALT